jgi:hypothetical protein
MNPFEPKSTEDVKPKTPAPKASKPRRLARPYKWPGENDAQKGVGDFNQVPRGARRGSRRSDFVSR